MDSNDRLDEQVADDHQPVVAAGDLWPLLLVVVVLGLDLVADAGSRSTTEVGAFDEPAHLATGILVVAAADRRSSRRRPPSPSCSPRWSASVAIDVDHMPQYLGWHALSDGTPRPYTHSLITPLAADRGGDLARGAGSARSRWVPPSASAPTCCAIWRRRAGCPCSGRSATLGVRIPYWIYLARAGPDRRRGERAAEARRDRGISTRLAQSPRSACLANACQAGFGVPSGRTRPK